MLTGKPSLETEGSGFEERVALKEVLPRGSQAEQHEQSCKGENAHICLGNEERYTVLDKEDMCCGGMEAEMRVLNTLSSLPKPTFSEG